MSKLGEALRRAVLENEPTLLAGDHDASTRAAAELAMLLGAVMGLILKQTPRQFNAIYQAATLRIHEVAHRQMAKKPADLTGH